MASVFPSTSAPAQQPGLRAYIVYNELPEGFLSFEVPDSSAEPFLHAGEFVVLDPEDRDPAEGELFVIRWNSGPRDRLHIVRMEQRSIRFQRDGATVEDGLWFVGAHAPRQTVSLAGTPIGAPMRHVDGPFPDAYCRAISLGKVVGIFEPDFRPLLAEVR